VSLTALIEDYHHTKAEVKVWKKAGGDKSATHDRGLTLGASEAFNCLRRAAYLKHPEWDVQVDPQYWGYANRGHQVEAFVISAIRESLEGGERLLYAGRSQMTFVHPLLPVSATPDGLYVPHKDERVYLEIKSVDPRTSPHKLPKEEHILQAQSGAEIMASVDPSKAPTRILLVYVDSSALKVVKEVPLDRDPAALEAHMRRAEKVFAAKNPLEVPAEGVFDRQCRHCPYKKACQPYAAMPGLPVAAPICW
jgi:CRISPR/Cas system-associated exonuclease Cas4 (RecB family)